MVDWWQPLLYTLAGGLITAVVSYAAHWWTAKASREAEERQAKRSLEEEERQVIRQLRRERIQPILVWLDMAKRSAGRVAVMSGLQVVTSPEDWPSRKSVLAKLYPSAIDEAQGFSVASFAGISIPGLQDHLGKILLALRSEDAQVKKPLVPALTAAEELLERYLSRVEPHPNKMTDAEPKAPKGA